VTFENFHLRPDLSFDENISTNNIPLPDQLPAKPQLSHIPSEILKSSTIETLISQNEDLMSRLKITIRRLQLLENENQELGQEILQTKKAYNAMKDQLSIEEDKDQNWKDKIRQLEQEKLQVEILLDAHLKQNDELQTANQSMKSQLERHKKYQEKIRTQIKPYIQDLKNYGQQLQEQVDRFQSEMDLKNSELQDALRSLSDIRTELSQSTESYEYQMKQLVQNFEQERSFLKKQILQLQIDLGAYQQTHSQLEKVRDERDHFENVVITLRRQNEDLKSQLENEQQQFRDEVKNLRLQNTEQLHRYQTLHDKVSKQEKELQTQQDLNLQLEEQMTGLRFLWSEKTAENDQLKLSLSALEKLNFELSQKLNELRNKPSAAQL
jgi:chromosome segregation ATPase